MYYRRDGRRRRYEEETPSRDANKNAPRRKFGGPRLTFLSLFAVAACLAVMRAVHPDVPLRSPIMMLASVTFACIIMIMIVRRNK